MSVDTQTEAVEAISNILMEAGAEGIQIDDSADKATFEAHDSTVMVDWETMPHRISGAVVTGFFATTIDVEKIALDVQTRVNQLADYGLNALPGSVKTNIVKEEDWATEWQKYYHPVRVTRHLTVLPKWETIPASQPDEKYIILDPGMAFGTGTHPTTQLMLQALEIVVRGGERMLDIGTGSGVLSIGARQLGVHQILATDIDEVAVQSAQQNIDLNPSATGIKVIPSDLLTSVPVQRYDIIVANMLSEVLVLLIPDLKTYVTPNGYVLLSGIYFDKKEAIVSQLGSAGFEIMETLQMGDWFGLICQLTTTEE